MKYHTELNIHKRRRFVASAWVFAILIILTTIALVLYAYYVVIGQQNKNTIASTTSGVTSSYYASSIKVFKSPYFQLQLDKNWSEIPQESTANKFVYRSLRSNIVEDELVIYVNSSSEDIAANRVLATNIKDGSRLSPASVSDHCINTAGGSSAQNKSVSIANTTFLCDPDSTNYTVLVGVIGGTSAFNLTRPDGSVAKYSIYYSNLRATFDSNQIISIVQNFQTR